MSVFGCGQIDPSHPNAEERQKSFLNYSYLIINVGCVVAFSFLAQGATEGFEPLGISKEDGYFAACLIAACAMVLASLLFLGGTSLCSKETDAGLRAASQAQSDPLYDRRDLTGDTRLAAASLSA